MKSFKNVNKIFIEAIKKGGWIFTDNMLINAQKSMAIKAVRSNKNGVLKADGDFCDLVLLRRSGVVKNSLEFWDNIDTLKELKELLKIK